MRRARAKSNSNLRQSAPKSKAIQIGGCRLVHGDCFSELARLAAGSIDAVITDPPYGVTDNAWDRAPDLAAWWREIDRVTKPSAVVAVFCQQPFTTAIITSNRKHWRYELVWHKPRPTGFLNANRQPLRCHEHVQIFSRRPSEAVYNPQMGIGKPYRTKRKSASTCYRAFREPTTVTNSTGQRYPRSVLEFTNPLHKAGHPTQKPLPLLEWLVLTYSRPGDLVLDTFMGSGTTAEACAKHGRRFVGIEMEAKYFHMAAERLT